MLVVEIVEKAVALGQAAHHAVGHLGGARVEPDLGPVECAQGGLGEVEVGFNSAIIDALIENPQGALLGGVIPLREAFPDLAQSGNIALGVVDELSPFVGMRIARGAAYLHVLRAGLAE